MINCIAVGCGGFAGAVLRYLMGKLAPAANTAFPITTFIINVIGAFAIGAITAYAAKNADFDPRLLLFLKVGLCGGFTTFSTFSLESVQLLGEGRYLTAAAYMLFSAAVCIIAVIAGQSIAGGA